MGAHFVWGHALHPDGLMRTATATFSWALFLCLVYGGGSLIFILFPSTTNNWWGEAAYLSSLTFRTKNNPLWPPTARQHCLRLNPFYVRQNLIDEAVKHISYFNEYYEDIDWIWKDHENPQTHLNKQSIDHLEPQRRSHTISCTDELWPPADEDNILNCLLDNSNSLVYIVLIFSNSWASQNALKQIKLNYYRLNESSLKNLF